MNRKAIDGVPVLHMYADEAAVTVRFSETESENLREQVRDILTGAYEERFQEELALRGQAM
ncbi:MAG: hypothetical protein LIO67_01535 [Lachnospiraceae bacterium]|nr:hypothetical protein [Lachnospiraceae bacterium]